jgi:hypothetical protein
LSENPHKPNSQRATNRPRRLPQKKEDEGRKTARKGQKSTQGRGKNEKKNRGGKEQQGREKNEAPGLGH